MSEKGYYVYYDGENIPYFVEAGTENASYDIPTDGTIYDPTTFEIWSPPDSANSGADEIELEPAQPEYVEEPAKPEYDEEPAQDEYVEEPGQDDYSDELAQDEIELEPAQPEYDEEPAQEDYVEEPMQEDYPEDLEQEEEIEEPDISDEMELNTGKGDIEITENLILDVPQKVANFKVRKAQTIGAPRTPVKIHDALDMDINDVAVIMDKELASNIHQFRIQDFARKYFREHRTNHVFNRKRIAIEALVSFSDHLLTEPLLEALDKNCSKLALQCFKNILVYTKVINGKMPTLAAESIVNTLQANAALRDEVFFQLIKQTSHTPTNEILKKGLELFLIIATIFPSSRNSENWIKAHLVNLARHPDILVAAMAQFTYIRFHARCAVGKPLERLPFKYVKKIPEQVTKSWQTFGSSIYEMMWNQRLKEPKLPIPFIEYYMADFLIKLGARETEGIFRLPGNLKKVEDMAEGTNDGKDMIHGAGLHDIASLFKKWFRDLPNPVVPVDRIDEIQNVYDDGDRQYVKFANELPRPHKMVLMFLIGFLQDLSKYQEKTMMTPKNFAIVFGPNIVQCGDINEPMLMKKYSDIAIEFMTTLIEEWDTSEIYPMRREYLAAPPPDME